MAALQTQVQDVVVVRTATEMLFAEPWNRGTPQKDSILLGLHMLADAMERDLSRGRAAEVYLAVLQDLTPTQCVRALSRASLRGRFFPAPGELRALAGVPDVDPEQEQANAALVLVLEAIKRFGVRMRPLRGKILRDRDDDGVGAGSRDSTSIF